MPVKKKPTAKQLAARKKFVEMVRARAKAKKSSKRQTGTTTKSKDKKIQAKALGKRKSASGKTYTERRSNRSDKGKLLGIGAFHNLSSGAKKLWMDINKKGFFKFNTEENVLKFLRKEYLSKNMKTKVKLIDELLSSY